MMTIHNNTPGYRPQIASYFLIFFQLFQSPTLFHHHLENIKEDYRKSPPLKSQATFPKQIRMSDPRANILASPTYWVCCKTPLGAVQESPVSFIRLKLDLESSDLKSIVPQEKFSRPANMQQMWPL